MKLRMNCQKATLPGLIALLGACATMGMAQTSTSTNTSATIATSSTDWSNTATVNQFSTTLGTLQSVEITLNWNTYQAIGATNTDSSSEEIYGTNQVNVNLTLPNSNPTLVGASPTVTVGSYSTNSDGLGDPGPTGTLAAGASDSATPVTTTSTSSVTLTDAADLATFSGASTVTMNIGTLTTVDEDESGGNITWSVTTQAGASVTVTYTYTPTATTTTSCISGQLWNNKCGDGVCGHSDEGGLGGGCKVYVCDTHGNCIQTCTTKSDGTWECTGLKPNCDYHCCVDPTCLPSGYCCIPPKCANWTPCSPQCYTPCCNPCCSFQCTPCTACPSAPCPTLPCTTPPSGCCTQINFPCCKPVNTGCFTSCCQTDWCSNALLCLLKLDCLDLHYCAVYPPDKCCELGGLNACCLFNSASCLLSFFDCQTGSCCLLPLGCLLDPASEDLGCLAGELCACKLNCDFSDACCFRSGFKNLCCQSGPFKGCTVQQVCTAAHCYLNGNTCLPCVPNCTPQDLYTCLHCINTCYGPNGSNGNGFCK